jgi:hypothetical protein
MRTVVIGAGVAGWALALAFAGCGGSSTSQPGGADGGDDGNGSEGAVGADGGQDAGQVEASPEAALDAPPDVPSGLVTAEVDAFCSGTYGTLRTAFESCCTTTDKTTQEYMAIDALLGQAQELCTTQLAKSVIAGRATFDPGASQSCVAAVQQIASMGVCWPTLENNQSSGPTFGSAPCNGVITGLTDEGQACAQDYECKDGLTCVGWTDSADGQCQIPPAQGLMCGPGMMTGGTITIEYGFGSHPGCQPGTYCAGTCIAQTQAGQSCVSNAECAPGLSCRVGTCNTNPPSGAGQACDLRSDCQNDLYCDHGDGGLGMGTCRGREDAGAGCSTGFAGCKGYCAVPDGGTVGACAAICGSG